MSELKRIFSQAKMNKDMDERIVPNGQYRDATNIEVATSEGSEVGTVQTLFGNTERNNVLQNTSSLENVINYTTTTAVMGAEAYNMLGPHNLASVVGTVADASTDRIYYLVSGGDLSSVDVDTSYFGATANLGVTNNVAKDYILEYDTTNNVHRYVFVDIFKVYTDVQASTSMADYIEGSTTFHISAQAGESGVPPGVRVGMSVTALDLTQAAGQQQVVAPLDELRVVSVTYNTSAGDDGNPLNLWQVTVNKPHGLSDNFVVEFEADRVLKFDKERLITGINILDSFLFWTDNYSEPKKINIQRSIAGTGGSVELDATNSEQIFFGDNDYFHTRLVKDKVLVADPNDAGSRYRIATNSINTYPVYTTEEHVTVIRKAPTQPLELEMYRTGVKRVNDDGIENPTSGVVAGGDWTWTNPATGELYTTENIMIEFWFANNIHLEEGDIILISDEELITNSANESAGYLIRAKVTGSPISDPNNIINGPFDLDILSISPNTPMSSFDEDQQVVDYTELGWGPWYVRLEDKRPMFENRFPRFSYRYKYQDGEYSPFAPFSQIAFLPDKYEYFPKKGYNLGMVNQLRSLRLRYYHHDEDIMPQDVVEIDILYKEAGRANVYTVKTLKKESDELGIVWPDSLVNQSHRGTFTISTDMIHAVVPSNQILRPYDNVPRQALAQEVSANRIIYGNYLQNFHIAKNPIIRVGYEQDKIGDEYYFPEGKWAYPSVKTMRKYQAGVVFSDGYGRETPVLTHESSTVTVLKDASDTRNRLTCQLDPKFVTHPSWAEYMSWYIKETSVEYYTMAMDRWYEAFDGNIWLSFPSSDRNKLDDETFIVLKKAHGTNEAVKEKARYRILAIENEAPDFIKTVKKSLGRIYNGPAAAGIIGEGGNGFPFQDASYIVVDVEEFKAVYGELQILTPDTIKLRFYGNGQRTEEYEISRVVLDGGTFRLSLVGRIGEDAAFLSTNDTFAGAIDGISMEIIEHEVENKPEFDGKFFVKIYKDDALEKYVLANQDIQYTIVDSQSLGYINNNGFTSANAQFGTLSSTDVHQIRFSDEDYYNNRAATYAGNLGVSVLSQYDAYNVSTGVRSVAGTAFHPTEHWHHSATGGNGGVLYQWNPPEGSSTADLGGNPYIAVNDAVNSEARDFWRDHVMPQRSFFIDACTAYSYTNGNFEQFAFPGINNSYGGTAVGDFFDGDGNPNFDFSNLLGGAPGPQPHDFDIGYPDGLPHAANTRIGCGQPSRGIWSSPSHPGVSFMDISWSGMGKGSSTPNIWGDGINGNGSNFGYGTGGSTNVNNNGNGIIHRISEVFYIAGGDDGGNDFSGITSEEVAEINTDFAAATTFINALVQINTKFKFSNDPDSVVYEVVDIPFPTLLETGSPNAEGYNNNVVFELGTNSQDGVWGIRNYRPSEGTNWENAKRVYESGNLRQRWTIAVRATTDFGGGAIGSYNAKYSPITGTGGYMLNEDGAIVADPAYEIETHGVLDQNNESTMRALNHDFTSFDNIQILAPFSDTSGGGQFTDKPGVWETEPKESVDIDIYYQASGLMPLNLNNSTNEEYLPIQQGGYGGTKFRVPSADGGFNEHTVTGFEDRTITFTPGIALGTQLGNNDSIVFTKRKSYSLTGHINEPGGQVQVGSTTLTLHSDTNIASQHMANQKHWLDWSNCWCFGNGVESDRIRDDYNAAQVDNGVKASTVLAEQVTEERREHGLIWSGIYNSTSGINDLNQFIAAEKITKDLNPVYGSIQNLLNRDTRLLMFCENKILRGVTNKDALYNADGNPQLIASNKVVGDTTPYVGEFGISTNPESLTVTPNNTYFSDVVRGKVLALGNQGDGIRVISDVGMKDHFGDLFASDVWRSIGTYDERKKEFNLSVYKKYNRNFPNPYEQTTTSYSELAKGWSSFKSFHPQQGVSLNNNYYTFSDGSLYEHHINTTRNNFYGVQGTSDITVLFNDQPNLVKSFMSLNYEGSIAKIPNFDTEATSSWLTGNYSSNSGLTANTITDGEYFNLAPDVSGWYASEVNTNLQECTNTYFKDKENKYYGYPSGATTTHGTHCDVTSSNIDEKESSVQGIGLASISHGDSTQGNIVCLTIANNTTSSYVGDDSTGGEWDTAADLAEDATRWVCTSQTIEVEAGGDIPANTSGELVTLEISPFDADGNPTGALLNAANFSIGPESSWGSTQITSAHYVNTPEGSLNVDPDNTSDIISVSVLDTGTPGTADNKVSIAVQFNPAETWPTADDTWYLDIDETVPKEEEDPPSIQSRKVCFHVRHPRILSPMTKPAMIYDITDQASLANESYTVYNSGTDIVETDITQAQVAYFPENDPQYEEGGTMSYPGDATTYLAPYTSGIVPFTHAHLTGINNVIQHEGYVTDGQTSLVAEYDFECLPHYLIPGGGVQISHYYFATENTASNIQATFSQMGEYEPYYTTQIIYGDTSDAEYWVDTSTFPIEVNYSGFVLKKFKLKVFYTPPPVGSTATPVGSMCFINPGPHMIDLRFNANGYVGWMVEPDTRMAELSDVLYSRNIGYDARDTYVRLLGKKGTSFDLSITKATSATDYTPSSYFNFETHRFQAAAAKLTSEIPPNGKFTQQVEVPVSTSNCYYNVVVEPGLNSSKTKPATFGANIPKALGDAVITQHGVKTVTIRPITETAANFGVIPTQSISVPAMYPGSRLVRRGAQSTWGIKGGNNSKSSNKITINKFNASIAIGSVLLTRYVDYGIPHNTTVTSIEENLITLSNAVSIPDGSDVHFLRKGSSTTAFSLAIPVKARYKIKSDIDFKGAVIASSKPLKRTANAAVVDGKVITLNEGSRGLVAGMAIQGNGLVDSVGYNYLRVVSVDFAARTVTVDVNQNIADDAKLSFVYPESIPSSGEFSQYGGSHSMKLTHMQVSSLDGDLMVEGYFDINWLGKDDTDINISIDNFITTT